MGHEACKPEQVGICGCTALIYACKQGLESVALKLLEWGSKACKQGQVDDDGYTALHYAQ